MRLFCFSLDQWCLAEPRSMCVRFFLGTAFMAAYRNRTGEGMGELMSARGLAATPENTVWHGHE
jgi:hypothetical protein